MSGFHLINMGVHTGDDNRLNSQIISNDMQDSFSCLLLSINLILFAAIHN